MSSSLERQNMSATADGVYDSCESESECEYSELECEIVSDSEYSENTEDIFTHIDDEKDESDRQQEQESRLCHPDKMTFIRAPIITLSHTEQEQYWKDFLNGKEQEQQELIDLEAETVRKQESEKRDALIERSKRLIEYFSKQNWFGEYVVRTEGGAIVSLIELPDIDEMVRMMMAGVKEQKKEEKKIELKGDKETELKGKLNILEGKMATRRKGRERAKLREKGGCNGGSGTGRDRRNGGKRKEIWGNSGSIGKDFGGKTGSKEKKGE